MFDLKTSILIKCSLLEKSLTCVKIFDSTFPRLSVIVDKENNSEMLKGKICATLLSLFSFFVNFTFVFCIYKLKIESFEKKRISN